MTEPPDPLAAQGPRAWPPLLLVAAAWALLRVPFLLWQAGVQLPDTWLQARAGLTAGPAVLTEAAIGITPATERLLRQRLPQDGRLVVFCPYPGEVFEKLLRDSFERLKNLLYPTPRDAAFARDAAELRGAIAPAFTGKLVVVDGTQENRELPVAAEFELLGEQRIGAGRLRFWLLRKAGG